MRAKVMAIMPDFVVRGWRYLRRDQRYVKLLTAVMAVITVLVIGQISYANWDTLLSLDWQFAPVWLLPTAVVIGLKLLLGGFGWHLLVYKTTGLNAPRYNLKVWWAANMARRIPGGIWYIASRAAMYDDYAVNKRTISAASVLELVVILTSGAITVIITSPFWVITREKILQSYDWALLLLIPLGFILIHPKFLAWIWRKLNNDTPMPALRWREMMALLAYYGLIWLLAGPMVYGIINLVYPLTAVYIPSLIGMWAVANIIATVSAFTIGGLGVRELSLAVLLSFIMPSPVAIVISLLIRIFWLLGEMITGLISFLL